jgi:predicted amidohydrolase
VFAFKDSWGAKRLGNKRLECAMTIRDGQIVYENDARGLPGGDQQIYDLLLKNAHVIDPANHRDGKFDIAVVGNKIARVAQDLPAAHARVAIDASAYYTTPGLIDVGTHLAGISADHHTLPFGVTTAVGAGESKTRLLTDPTASITDETISSDSGNMTTAMSKFLSLGITLDRTIERATINPARALHRPDLGTLSEGAVADIALFELIGKRRLRCVLTIRNGAVVWDSEGLSAPDWIQAGQYTNFK